MKQRNITVDLMRTLAIVLMVVFHFIYDLRSFGYVAWDIPDGFGWKHFRYLILTLFFLCVGIGLVYAHKAAVRWRDFGRRLLYVLVGAGLVTAMSLVMFPTHWIYFGVLHFIVVASVLALPLVAQPNVALVAGVVMVLAFNLGWIGSGWPFVYIGQWLPSYANDFVPLIPWLGVVWLGIALGHSDTLDRDPLQKVPFNKSLATPGRHSLMIYLVHQPIMVGIISAVRYLF